MKARLAVAKQMQLKFFGGGCDRCKMPWALVSNHCTDYIIYPGGGVGIFVLCEDCWLGLGQAQFRWPYYERTWKKAHASLRPFSDLALLKTAVWNEKNEPNREGILLLK